jgi:5-methylcytosine-specific restriction endonuclease McrA
MKQKICTKCKTEKPINEFYWRESRQNYSPKCKICWNEDTKEYNKGEKFKKYQNEYKRKKGLTPQQKIISNLRHRVYDLIKKELKSQSTLELIGCSREEFIHFIENQFTEYMNWNNYGIYWELDHIYPLSKGGSFHYTNCQPLTVNENRTKNNKINNGQ